MKIVVNNCYGGVSVSDFVVKELNLNSEYDFNRLDPRLVAMVEEDSEKASGKHAMLEVIEIPDAATDWEINDYDGLEDVTYVLDGKLHHI